jgi:hypothetical protein
MDRYKSFFHFQHTALLGLWRWGLASMLGGGLLMLTRSTLLRALGLQALVWGAIDAALAFFGQRGARRHIRGGAQDGPAHARRFRLIVAVNAALDVLYVLLGLRLIRGSAGRSARRGTGLGILTQGVFLLVYDTALAIATGRWTRG